MNSSSASHIIRCLGENSEEITGKDNIKNENIIHLGEPSHKYLFFFVRFSFLIKLTGA